MIRKYLLVGASAFILGAGSMAYVSANAFAQAEGSDTYHMLQLFGDVMSLVKTSYVAPVDDKKLIEASIDGMLTSLDPHSGYLSPDDFKDMREQTSGQYGGLGLEVTSEEGVVKVITAMDDTPAAKAGIEPGDYITAINGETVLGLQLDDAVKQMRGEPGEGITLTIARPKKDPFDVKLVRQIISVKSVKARMEGAYGVIRISVINENTGKETADAVRDLQAKSPAMKGIVLDLRNNPGGLLDQAVSTTDVFLDGGEVVSERGRSPKDVDRFNARPGDLTNGLPIAVLINSGSASAAEIIAGALQDRHRAVLVGTTSFGKGSVQSVIPLRNGEDGALKLTTGRYYTPSGRSIQKTGIEPDLEVARSTDEAELIKSKSFQFSEASFRNALNASEGKVRREAHEVAEAPPATFDKKGDYQLFRAIAVLKAGSVQQLLASEKKPTQVATVSGPARPAPSSVKTGVVPPKATAPTPSKELSPPDKVEKKPDGK
jgi:carboxyl-terminal processing protease